ncbi:MAG: hypothetical protein PHE80_03290 [Candidatus Omnitrophica bacterium]|nr:hypothetical protein [Candidatus Omnitrophota bacterium]MDD5737475.1 hypothetical protein [Candidatus Omnitrophota bacterium]
MRRAAILVFAVVCCLSAAELVFRMRNWVYEGTDIEAEQARYSTMKPYLPPGGKVGYETDDTENDIRKHYIMQYALCPVVIDRSGQHEYVIKEERGEVGVIKRRPGGR